MPRDQEVMSPNGGGTSDVKPIIEMVLGVVGFLIILFLTSAVGDVVAGGRVTQGVGSIFSVKTWIAVFGNGFSLWKLAGGDGVMPLVWWIVFVIEWIAIGFGLYWGYVFWRGGKIHQLNLLPKNITSGSEHPFPKTVHLATLNDLSLLWNKKKSYSRYPQQGIILGEKDGHILRTDGESSVFVVGPTRSGKTTSLIVPNLFDWEGAVIATSTKAELVLETAAVRQRIGPTWVYDPSGELKDLLVDGKPFPIESISYSPLEGCTDINVAINTAKALAQGGLKSSKGGGESNDWRHWYEKSWNMLAPSMYAAAHVGLTLETIRDWIFHSDLSTVEMIINTQVQDSERSIAKANSLLNATLSLVDREQASAFSVTQGIFGPWWNDQISENSSTNEYDPIRLLKERGTLYLCTPADKPNEVASLFVAILEKTITAAYQLAKSLPNERLEIPLLLALDELANVCPVERLDSIASSGAGRGVLCLSIVQDYSQLVTAYSETNAQTIFNNHPCKLFLPGITDTRTTEMISKLVGSGQVTSISRSSGGQGSGSTTYSTQERALITPDRISQLKFGQAILIHKGLQPAIIKLMPFFSTPRYAKKAKMEYYANTEFLQGHDDEEDLLE